MAADHLIRALGMAGRVRCVALVATDTVEELRRVHDPSPTVTAAMGRLAMGALLLASSLEKVTGREPLLTVEVEGDGPAGRMFATASPLGWVRATVDRPLAAAELRQDGSLDVPAVVGTQGHLVVTRDPGPGRPVYRGITPLRSGEIARDLVHYLVDSEQSPAAVVLADHLLREGRIGRAGGFLLQVLPGVREDEAEDLERRVRSLGQLSSRLRDGQHPLEWMGHLFPEGFVTLEETPVRFHCGCSTERVERVVQLLGAAEIRDLLAMNDDGSAELSCGFCRRIYALSRDDLLRLLLDLEVDDRREPDA